MRKLIAAVAGLCLIAVPAQAMSVADFLAKVSALKAKGMAAMFSSDIGVLKREVEAVAKDYRGDLVAQRNAGRKPHSCPPPEGQGKIGSKELLESFNRIPAAQRGMSVKQGFYRMMAERYPCS